MLSRVADSLYWMSRYLERAEHTARLLDVNLQGMLDQAGESDEQRWEHLTRAIGLRALSDGSPLPREAYPVTQLLTFDTRVQNSIRSCISLARENARQVRQQLSSEMWEQLNRLYLMMRDATMADVWNAQPHEFFRSVKEGVHLFQGITDSTLSHGEGWRFIQTGRFLERASATAHLLDVQFTGFRHLTDSDIDAGVYLRWVSLLKSCTAYEAYCKVYTADVRPERIAEFLLLDRDFPRSVAYCARKVQTALEAIAEMTDKRKSVKPNRMAGKLCADLDFGTIDEFLGAGIHGVLDEVQTLCGRVHESINELYITYPIESALSG